MIRKIASVAALAIATLPMVALTANMASAVGSSSHQTSSDVNKVRLSQVVVNGLNVKVVNHSEGSFMDLGNGNWGEADLQNNIRFNFQETNRDEWSVYLLDKSRNVNIQLDLFRKKIIYSDSHNKFDLYTITQVSAVAQSKPSTSKIKVTIFNQGGYRADFYVNGGNYELLLGQKRTFLVPSDTPITVKAIEDTGLVGAGRWKTIFNETLSSPPPSAICFKTYGTTLFPFWNNNCTE